MQTAEALRLLLLITQGARRWMEALEDVSQMIEKANSENRDLSEDEVAMIRKRTDNAIADLERLK